MTIIDSLKPSVMKFDLDRMRVVMAALGNPQDSFPSVHVAGTNGKGSVCAMMAVSLKKSGLRTGLYTSPHLEKLNERFQIDGRLISDADLNRLSRRLFKQFPHLTQFEFLTVLAFCWFAEQHVDVAVLEVGLGGRLDATNLIRRPLLTIITNIDLDHMNWLGRTKEKIAFEKAGIIKPGVPVVTAAAGGALRVIKSVARAQHAPLLHITHAFSEKIALEGLHQQWNAAVAGTALIFLRDRLPGLTFNAIDSGLRETHWPGRFERFLVGSGRNRRLVILDGAHNPAGCRRLVETLRREKLAPVNLLFSALKDKDARSMAGILSPVAETCITVPVPSERSSAASRLANLPAWRGRAAFRTTAEHGFYDALNSKNDRPVVVAGSLYLVGEIRRRLR